MRSREMRIAVDTKIREQIEALCDMPSSKAKMRDQDVEFIDSLAKYIEKNDSISLKQFGWLEDMVKKYNP